LWCCANGVWVRSAERCKPRPAGANGAPRKRAGRSHRRRPLRPEAEASRAARPRVRAPPVFRVCGGFLPQTRAARLLGAGGVFPRPQHEGSATGARLAVP
jgi:hypothetical protein